MKRNLKTTFLLMTAILVVALLSGASHALILAFGVGLLLFALNVVILVWAVDWFFSAAVAERDVILEEGTRGRAVFAVAALGMKVCLLATVVYVSLCVFALSAPALVSGFATGLLALAAASLFWARRESRLQVAVTSLN